MGEGMPSKEEQDKAAEEMMTDEEIKEQVKKWLVGAEKEVERVEEEKKKEKEPVKITSDEPEKPTFYMSEDQLTELKTLVETAKKFLGEE